MADILHAFNVEQGISLSDKVGIFQGDADPIISGEAAPTGSLYLRTTGQTYSKVGLLDTEWTLNASGATASDHGVLSGLLDDDHPQYHNDARGDLRYSQLSHSHTVDGLTDAVISTVENGDVLMFNNVTGNWENQPLIGNPVMGGVIKIAQSANIPALNGTAAIPYDNTTPLITEGAELWTYTMTPDRIGSTVVIFTTGTVEVATSNKQVVLSFFRDSVCVGVSITNLNSASRPQFISAIIKDTSISTGPTTYSCRVGVAGAAATWYFNRQATLYFNGMLAKNSYILLEY